MLIYKDEEQVKFPEEYCLTTRVKNYLEEVILENSEQINNLEFAMDLGILRTDVLVMNRENKNTFGKQFSKGTQKEFCVKDLYDALPGDNITLMLRKNAFPYKNRYSTAESYAEFSDLILKHEFNVPKTRNFVTTQINLDCNECELPKGMSFFQAAVLYNRLDAVLHFLQHQNPNLEAFSCPAKLQRFVLPMEGKNIFYFAKGNVKILKLLLERLERKKPEDLMHLQFLEPQFLNSLASTDFSGELSKLNVYDCIKQMKKNPIHYDSDGEGKKEKIKPDNPRPVHQLFLPHQFTGRTMVASNGKILKQINI